MGWQPVAFTLLVIEGGSAGAGLFLYDGTPAEGTLVLAMVPTSTEDSFGNVAPAIFNAGVWANDGTPAQHFGIDANGKTYWVNASDVTTLFGNGETGSIQAGTVVYMDPGEVTHPEAWHYVGTAGQPAFGSDWSNFGHNAAALAFKKVAAPDNGLWINGVITPSSNTPQEMFTLPADYVPASTQFVVGNNESNGTIAIWQIDNTGGVGLTTGQTSGEVYSINGLVSLDI